MLGKRVSWVRRTNGSNKIRHGVVVVEVAARQDAFRIFTKIEEVRARGLSKKTPWRFVSGGGLLREEISYLVKVRGPKVDYIYWPRVSALKIEK